MRTKVQVARKILRRVLDTPLTIDIHRTIDLRWRDNRRDPERKTGRWNGEGEKSRCSSRTCSVSFRRNRRSKLRWSGKRILNRVIFGSFSAGSAGKRA